MMLPGNEVSKRYEVLRVLGRGGYAIVFEALDHRLRRIVALKTILPNHPDPAAAPRLRREAEAMASIHHPNVCSVSDIGVFDDGRPFFVMDRLEGESLRETLNRETFTNAEAAVDVAIEVLSALHATHSAGYVHRDVKPDNVFLTRRSACRPLVKLLDFGCCAPI